MEHNNFLKLLQSKTVIVRDKVITARNNGLINSVQLSAWRGNGDMQYCVSKCKVIDYITKYATKSEPRSQMMKEIFSNITRNLNDDSSALQVVQKLLTNSVAVRDFQLKRPATCFFNYHLWNPLEIIVYLVLLVTSNQDEEIAPLQLLYLLYCTAMYNDHKIPLDDLTLLHFAQNYPLPKESGRPPKKHKMKIVTVRPYYSPDQSGPSAVSRSWCYMFHSAIWLS